MEKSRLKYDVCQGFMEPDHANDDNLENCLPFGEHFFQIPSNDYRGT